MAEQLAIGRERVRAAEIAESEMFLYRLAQTIGADLESATAMIGELRRQRIEQVIGQKVESA